MFNLKFVISIFIFSVFLIFTSTIKNKTRIIEKKIKKIDTEISKIEKDFYETELDFTYLSSPKNLSKKINELSLTNYIPMDFSRIYLDYKEFIRSQKKITTLTTNNEKKIQKK